MKTVPKTTPFSLYREKRDGLRTTLSGGKGGRKPPCLFRYAGTVDFQTITIAHCAR